MSINYDNLCSAANMRCERSRMREWCGKVFLNLFLSNWDGAPLGLGALLILHILRIGSGGSA